MLRLKRAILIFMAAALIMQIMKNMLCNERNFVLLVKSLNLWCGCVQYVFVCMLYLLEIECSKNCSFTPNAFWMRLCVLKVQCVSLTCDRANKQQICLLKEKKSVTGV